MSPKETFKNKSSQGNIIMKAYKLQLIEIAISYNSHLS